MRVLTFARDLWRNRRGLVNRPRYLTYLVTFRCNARCLMCDSWRKPPSEELNLSQLDQIFRQLPLMDSVRLTGGEPFLREDLPSIADLCVRRLEPLLLHITTNGFLTRRIVEFCEERDRHVPLMLLISLDGLKAKHNQVRGRDSAWDQTWATLTELAPRQKELRLRLAVNQTVVDAEGVEHCRQLREWLRPRNIKHHAVLAYSESATFGTGQDPSPSGPELSTLKWHGSLAPAQIRELLEELIQGLPELPFAERVAKRFYYTHLLARELTPQQISSGICVALRSHLRLNPNGDVPVCQFNRHVVGNLSRQAFEEIWWNSAATKQRSWIAQCSGCFAECELLPNAIYSGDLLRHWVRSLRQRTPRGGTRTTGFLLKSFNYFKP